MEELKNIEFRGIGAGLLTTSRRELSPGESTITLNDDWQAQPTDQTLEHGSYSNTSTTESNLEFEPGTRSSEGSSAANHETPPVSLTNEQYLQLSVTPLERYCCQVEAHEQLAVGEITDRQSLERLAKLDDSLCAVAKSLPRFVPRYSTSSSSALSSTASEDPNMIAVQETDLLMKDPAELQATMQEEEAVHLHKIAKMRRRLKAEGSRRTMKSTRVRKRSKTSDKSNEAGR
ncbi:hypothetical protein F4678DRAFT_457503 [Xylaria arbuscula]|nr:hypothetical protein F4678DRAFT_457503 [Xylaria arbuscula]